MLNTLLQKISLLSETMESTTTTTTTTQEITEAVTEAVTEVTTGAETVLEGVTESVTEMVTEAVSAVANGGFDPKAFVDNLKYMGAGMVGIFLVIGAIILSIVLLGKLTDKKKNDE